MRSTRIITRKALCILLVFCVLAGFGSNRALAADVKADRLTLNQASTVDEIFLKNSQEANIAYTKLLESFANHKSNVYSEEYGSYRVNNIYASGFPDYYAGAYTNKEGNLVVLLNSTQSRAEKEAAKKAVIELTKNEDIIFSEAEHSYKELVGVMSEILSFCEKDEVSSTKEYGIAGFAIDDYNNQIVVHMTSVVDEAQKWFITNVVDSTCIRFEQQEVYSKNSAGTVNCSEGLKRSVDNDVFCSVGFRAKYTNSSGNTVYGFMTCGHGFTGETSRNLYTMDNDILGYLVPEKNMYEDGDCIDAAFFKLSVGSTVNPTVEPAYDPAYGPPYQISTTSIITVSQGTPVRMYGGATNRDFGYIRIGSVLSSSCTDCAIDRVCLTDMVKASYLGIVGDSGGLVFVEASNGNIACGIQSRINTTYSIFCKATNITSRFNVSIY